jgi:hypothetical protein
VVSPPPPKETGGGLPIRDLPTGKEPPKGKTPPKGGGSGIVRDTPF